MSFLHWPPRTTLCLARHPLVFFPYPRMGLLKESSSLPWAREDGTFKGPPGIAKPSAGSVTEGVGGMTATQKPGALCTSGLSGQGPIYLLWHR